MKSLAGYLLFFGLGSIVLDYLNMEFIVLAWIDTWGREVGWGIRIGMLVLGAILWLVANAKEKSAGAEA